MHGWLVRTDSGEVKIRWRSLIAGLAVYVVTFATTALVIGYFTGFRSRAMTSVLLSY